MSCPRRTPVDCMWPHFKEKNIVRGSCGLVETEQQEDPPPPADPLLNWLKGPLCVPDLQGCAFSQYLLHLVLPAFCFFEEKKGGWREGGGGRSAL